MKITQKIGSSGKRQTITIGPFLTWEAAEMYLTRMGFSKNNIRGNAWRNGDTGDTAMVEPDDIDTPEPLEPSDLPAQSDDVSQGRHTNWYQVGRTHFRRVGLDAALNQAKTYTGASRQWYLRGLMDAAEEFRRMTNS